MSFNVIRAKSSLLTAAALFPLISMLAAAQERPTQTGGEANLILPDLSQATFFGGAINGQTLLTFGLLIVALGLVFGLVIYNQLKNAPVHSSMLEISELIYETCKTYLITQIKFLIILEIFIGTIIVFYFGFLQHFSFVKVFVILMFSIIGICGSSGVAWFGIRVNTFANSRCAFASLTGKPFPCYEIPLKAGMSIGMLLISVELVLMLVHLALHSARLRRPLFHRLRHWRIAGRSGVARSRRHFHQDCRYRR